MYHSILPPPVLKGRGGALMKKSQNEYQISFAFVICLLSQIVPSVSSSDRKTSSSWLLWTWLVLVSLVIYVTLFVLSYPTRGTIGEYDMMLLRVKWLLFYSWKGLSWDSFSDPCPLLY